MQANDLAAQGGSTHTTKILVCDPGKHNKK